MAFVNEFISDADRKRFGSTDASDFYRAGADNWTVDRERDMFLVRRTGAGPETPPGEADWAFSWHGHLLDVRLRVVERGGDDVSGHGWEHTLVLSIGRMSSELLGKRAEILADLKEALTARKGSGVHSRRASYDVKLDA